MCDAGLPLGGVPGAYYESIQYTWKLTQGAVLANQSVSVNLLNEYKYGIVTQRPLLLDGVSLVEL